MLRDIILLLKCFLSVLMWSCSVLNVFPGDLFVIIRRDFLSQNMFSRASKHWDFQTYIPRCNKTTGFPTKIFAGLLNIDHILVLKWAQSKSQIIVFFFQKLEFTMLVNFSYWIIEFLLVPRASVSQRYCQKLPEGSREADKKVLTNQVILHIH